MYDFAMGALISMAKCCISDEADDEVASEGIVSEGIDVESVSNSESDTRAKSTFFGKSESSGNLSRSLFQKEFSSAIVDHPHSS